MTPAVWIALAYGVVAAAVVLYVVHLRRRLRRTRPGRGEETR
ncbi:MAG: hypothetical protein QN173_05720 [Armatimonadota bacterium]|nr:hypothetical protein [Armatimonadota bacterium]MDR7402408.1 hypothetical protein [Armatimonadota bacterium]MDR7404252.1 hypothetical protein [Armatimonadota bacterium]MDR7437571.1 hypothetical protein [Armatimonadota bacterium]MDR7472165.1 hypothetical protein [Armatimonadota bacterium]